MEINVIPGNDCIIVTPIDRFILSVVRKCTVRLPSNFRRLNVNFAQCCGHSHDMMISTGICQFPSVEEHGSFIGVNRNIDTLLYLDLRAFIHVCTSGAVHHFYGSRVFKDHASGLSCNRSKRQSFDPPTDIQLPMGEMTCR